MTTLRHLQLLMLAALFGLLLGCPSGTGPGSGVSAPPDEVSLDTLLKVARAGSGQPTFYAPPTLSERVNLQKLVPDFAQALHAGVVDVSEFRPRFKESGLHLQQVDVGGEPCYAVFEGGETWRGTGVYVFRAGPTPEVLLQAPHSFHDQYTGDLVLETFRKTKARGVYLNSIHRYRSHPDEDPDGVSHPADMAHNTDSVFYMMSIEYLRTVRDALVVQLHGYGNPKLREAGYDVVVSDGTDTPHPRVRRAAEILAAGVKEKVAIYPDDTRKLGATGNTVGRWVTHAKAGAFLHLELSLQVRQAWKTDVSTLVNLVNALASDL